MIPQPSIAAWTWIDPLHSQGHHQNVTVPSQHTFQSSPQFSPQSDPIHAQSWLLHQHTLLATLLDAGHTLHLSWIQSSPSQSSKQSISVSFPNPVLPSIALSYHHDILELFLLTLPNIAYTLRFTPPDYFHLDLQNSWSTEQSLSSLLGSKIPILVHSLGPSLAAEGLVIATLDGTFIKAEWLPEQSGPLTMVFMFYSNLMD